MKQNKTIKYFSAFFCFIGYLIFILFIDFNSIDKGYQVTTILPLVFLCCFYGFLWSPITQKKTPFLVLFSCVAFVRYVVLSIVTIVNGTYVGLSGVTPSSNSLKLAGILMVWELIIASLLIRIWSKKIICKDEKQLLSSQAHPGIYIIFFLMTGVLMVAVPQSRIGLSFFGNISRAFNDEIGSQLVLGIRESFINAKYFLLFAVIILLQSKNGINFSRNRFFSYICVLLFCVIIIGFRIGANRKKMLSDAIASILVLWKLFPKYRRTTAISLLSVGLILVASTTVFRGMTDTVGGFFSEYLNLDFLQPYFLGQYNVAIAIEAKEFYPRMFDINTYLLSFLRPIFGIGSIIKKIDFTMAANLFDARMSAGLSGWRGDHILPMIGEGYMLFGIVLSPIILAITIRLGIYFDSLYYKSPKLELVFISTIISFYLAQGMILNSTIILNMLSFRLAIYIPVVYLAYILKNNEKG